MISRNNGIVIQKSKFDKNRVFTDLGCSAMSLRIKIIIAIGIFISIILACGTYSIVNSKSSNSAHEMLLQDSRTQFLIKSIQFRLAGRSNDERAFLLKGDASFVNEMQKKDEDIQSYLTELVQTVEPSDKEIVEAIQANLQDFQRASQQVVESYQKGDKQRADELHFGEEREARKKLDPVISDFEKEMKVRFDSAKSQLEQSHQFQTMLLSTFIGLAVLFGLFIGYLFMRTVMRPLSIVNGQLKEIAEGEADLTRQLPVLSKDEIGQLAASFNQMMVNLRELISQVTKNAVQLSTATEDLFVSSQRTMQSTDSIINMIQEVATGSNTQLQSAQHTVSTIDSITSDIHTIATSVETAKHSTNEATHKAQEGNHSIQRAIHQIDSIRQSVGDTSQLVQQLGSRSHEIGQVVDIITDIANQTNLLALNAAIEAARAGEHGRGFSVVADEVRKLAEQSKNSTEQIKLLIEHIQADTKQAMNAMDKGNEEVQEGIAVIHLAGKNFESILSSVDQVTTQVDEVYKVGEQMRRNSDRITGSISEMERIADEASHSTQGVVASSQEQYASIEEMAASIESLRRMAAHLHEMVGRFKVE